MAFSLAAGTKEEKEGKDCHSILERVCLLIFVLEWIRCIGKAIVASRRGDAWQDDVDAYGNPREAKN